MAAAADGSDTVMADVVEKLNALAVECFHGNLKLAGDALRNASASADSHGGCVARQMKGSVSCADAAPLLSKGYVTDLNSRAGSTVKKPVLQVVEVLCKKHPVGYDKGEEASLKCYRLVLSDGSHTFNGCVDTSCVSTVMPCVTPCCKEWCGWQNPNTLVFPVIRLLDFSESFIDTRRGLSLLIKAVEPVCTKLNGADVAITCSTPIGTPQRYDPKTPTTQPMGRRACRKRPTSPRDDNDHDTVATHGLDSARRANLFASDSHESGRDDDGESAAHSDHNRAGGNSNGNSDRNGSDKHSDDSNLDDDDVGAVPNHAKDCTGGPNGFCAVAGRVYPRCVVKGAILLPTWSDVIDCANVVWHIRSGRNPYDGNLLRAPNKTKRHGFYVWFACNLYGIHGKDNVQRMPRCIKWWIRQKFPLSRAELAFTDNDDNDADNDDGGSIHSEASVASRHAFGTDEEGSSSDGDSDDEVLDSFDIDPDRS